LRQIFNLYFYFLIIFKESRSEAAAQNVIVGLPEVDTDTPIVIGNYIYQEVNGSLEVQFKFKCHLLLQFIFICTM
jgi:hypothetical protein